MTGRHWSFTVRVSEIALFALFCIMLLATAVLPEALVILYAVIIALWIAVSCRNGYIKGDSALISQICAFTVLLSAVQNIYLGLLIDNLEQLELQILLTLNIAIMAFSVALFWTRRINWTSALLIVLTIISVIQFLIFSPVPTAYISSLRNIIAPILIYSYAVSYGREMDKRYLYRLLLLIAWIVVIVGLIEYCVGSTFWIGLNITKLWNMKGIETHSISGVPMNWYASEKIGGVQIRRMVSSFADPVNLGSYLFAAFMLAWYKRKTILKVLLFVCCVLCVSKGALLGFLIFAVVYTWYKDRTKLLVPTAIAGMLCIGLLFVRFSINSSTGSMAYHVKNFVDSIGVFVKNPLGLGVGNVGVMAKIMGAKVSAGIVETGIGAITSQLGIFGILIYSVFFWKLFREPVGWDPDRRNKKVLYYSLLISYLANMVFNEVALSPNSCGMYFILLGVLTGEDFFEKKDEKEGQRNESIAN